MAKEIKCTLKHENGMYGYTKVEVTMKGKIYEVQYVQIDNFLNLTGVWVRSAGTEEYEHVTGPQFHTFYSAFAAFSAGHLGECEDDISPAAIMSMVCDVVAMCVGGWA